MFGRGGGLSIWAGRQGKGVGGGIIVYVYPCHQVYGGATLGSNHQRSSELKKILLVKNNILDPRSLH